MKMSGLEISRSDKAYGADAVSGTTHQSAPPARLPAPETTAESDACLYQPHS